MSIRTSASRVPQQSPGSRFERVLRIGAALHGQKNVSENKILETLPVGMDQGDRDLSKIPRVDKSESMLPQMPPQIIFEILKNNMLAKDSNYKTVCTEFIKFCRFITKEKSMCTEDTWQGGIKVLGVTSDIAAKYFRGMTAEEIFVALCKDMNAKRMPPLPKLTRQASVYHHGLVPDDIEQTCTVDAGLVHPTVSTGPFVEIADSPRFDREWIETYLEAMRTKHFNKKARQLIRETAPDRLGNSVNAIQSVLHGYGFVGSNDADWEQLDNQLRNLALSSIPNLAAIEDLIKKGADVDLLITYDPTFAILNTFQEPLIFTALFSRKYELAELLLRYGAGTARRDSKKQSIFVRIFYSQGMANTMMVAKEDRARILTLLLEASDETREKFEADDHDIMKDTEMRAGLNLALDRNDTDIALLIVEHDNFDVNEQLDHRRMVIFDAIYYNNAPVVRKILEKMKDKKYMRSSKYGTLLEYALKRKALAAVAVLLEDPEYKNQIPVSLTRFVNNLQTAEPSDNYSLVLAFLKERNL